jgi:plasmid rolling circle replication initiator protein Rep
MRRHDPEKENPDTVAADIGVQGIEALPKRVERYGKAKDHALDVAEYIEAHGGPQHIKVSQRVASCGDYLVFRHYFTVDQAKLAGARLCNKHLLCNLCAIRRGAKYLAAYLQRFELLRAENPNLRAYLVTLTVKDGPDLKERFDHLVKSQRELWKQKQRGRGSPLDGVFGAVWSYEIKRGSSSGLWHPHLHMVVLAESLPTENYQAGTLGALSAAWHNITRDSFMVDVRPISQDDPASGFIEVFKYAVKFNQQSLEDTFHAFVTLRGKRLIASAGAFRGVPEPPDLLDDVEALEGLPYITLFYRYLPGGYTLSSGAREGV